MKSYATIPVLLFFSIHVTAQSFPAFWEGRWVGEVEVWSPAIQHHGVFNAMRASLSREE